MAVERHRDVMNMDDAAFAEWRTRKVRQLKGGQGPARRRGPHNVIRKYVKLRRNWQERTGQAGG